MRADAARAAGPVSLWRRSVAIVRLALILTITLCVALSLWLGRLALFASPRLRRRWRVLHFNAWSRAVCRVLGGSTIVAGRPPAAPFFLASNHLGYLDIVVLAQLLPAVFVAKADVRDWPLVGWLTRLADTLYVNRERSRDIPRANRAIADAIATGDSVVLFPEGTSSGSDLVLPIRPPLLQVAAQNGIGVSTAALYFVTRSGDPHAHGAICYYGNMTFVSHVWRLLHIRGFTVTIRFGERLHIAGDRKALAEAVREEILELQSRNTNNTKAYASPEDGAAQVKTMRQNR